MRWEGLARECVHCAGLHKESGVELLITKMEVQSGGGHTNHLTALGSTAERSDELNCELVFVIGRATRYEVA
jgi:hypothetical protein